MQLIKRFSAFELSPTLAANEKAQIMRDAGKSVIHMGFGQSPFPVPERLQRALGGHVIEKSYLPTAGLDELRTTVLAYYQDKAGINADDYDVMVAPGSKLILYALQMAIEGDLLLTVPSWVSYAPQSHMLARHVIKVPTCLGNDGYYIDPEQLAATIRDARSEGHNPRKIILNYPSNPTGLSITHQNLNDIADVCRKEGIFIISDEIYGLVSFEKQYRSISQFAPDITAVSTGLSKHLSLGGWRMGVGLIPKAVDGLFSMMNNIASETWSCVSSPLQYAAIEAYKGHKDIENHIERCTDIHQLMNCYLAQGFKDIGLNIAMPQGAFYTYPDFGPFKERLDKRMIRTSQELADSLLEEQGVLTLPGHVFGDAPDVLTLRVSGCDYDGGAALRAYVDGQKLNDEFIADYAPNIFEAPRRYKAFLKH